MPTAPDATSSRRTGDAGRLVLHIGFHQTETSVIQESLFHGRDRLDRQGVVYPQSLSGHPSHLDLATALGFNPRPDELHDLDPEAVIERYRLLIGGCRPGSTVIISSEEFCLGNYRPRAMDNLRAFCRDLALELSVVAYVRDPLRFLSAIYHRELRDTERSLRFGEWLDRFDLEGANFDRRLDTWRESLEGMAELVIRDYDAVTADGRSVLRDFLDACDLDEMMVDPVGDHRREIHPLLVEAVVAVRQAGFDPVITRSYLDDLIQIGSLMAPVDPVSVHLGRHDLDQLKERLGR